MGTTMNFRIDEETKNILSKTAKKMGLSLSEYARLVLKQNSIQIVNKKRNLIKK